ncbi:methylenetetrahydrofolate reductase [Aureimonas ureilytica]|uniref:Methylenetetrahydrofolate reductase n=1 Tax=Aureimonas ureilytica TaxID=401562 RepID=A0A175RAA7_9HYPH|nr:hypothetical protein [Aureimonas ureilytica]KTQ96982.1 methylenetetrahydrofolate reductase [Aureimonas ureilytica]
MMAPAPLAASIEVSPKQAIESPDLPGLFPPATRVYVTDLGSDGEETLVRAVRRLADLGYVAVPHLAARRAGARAAVEARIGALAERGGAREMLVIGGGPDRPAGDFATALDILETGFLDRFGYTDVAVAGHPETSSGFPADAAMRALRAKADFAARTDARMRIVTQFGFDGPAFVAWAQGLAAEGVDLPVHLGVAGPAKLTTLLKYAMACGVGNSLGFLRKRALSFGALATQQSPEDVVAPVERHVQTHPDGPIRQIHVFAFGGLTGAAHWLRERGSW